jgi:hypothetical protein
VTFTRQWRVLDYPPTPTVLKHDALPSATSMACGLKICRRAAEAEKGDAAVDWVKQSKTAVYKPRPWDPCVVFLTHRVNVSGFHDTLLLVFCQAQVQGHLHNLSQELVYHPEWLGQAVYGSGWVKEWREGRQCCTACPCLPLLAHAVWKGKLPLYVDGVSPAPVP